MRPVSELVFLLPKPFSGIGGVERIIVTLAEEVAAGRIPSLRLRAIVPKNSYVERELRSIASHKIQIDYVLEKSVFLGNEALFVGWGGLGNLLRCLTGNPRILIWSILPGNPLAHLNSSSRIMPQWIVNHLRSRLARCLVSTNSVWFMDGPNRAEFEKNTGRMAPETYLPIPVAVDSNRYLNGSRKRTGSSINISYLGRGNVAWKVYPFVTFVKLCLGLGANPLIRVYTDNENLFRDVFKQAGLENLTVSYVLGISGSKLRSELVTWSDIHVGMGTSVLEGAACGIPSICVDPAFNLEKPVSWSWLFDRKDFDLGDFNCKYTDSDVSVLKDCLLRKDRLENYSGLTYDYVQQNHAAPLVLGKLIDSTTKAQLFDYIYAHSAFAWLVFWIKTVILKTRSGWFR